MIVDQHYYKLIIAYDGTEYQGWQEQPHKNTVKDTLVAAFKVVFKCESYLVAASRTDAGVHALGQVALVRTTLALDPVLLQRAWNNALPSSISIRSIQRVDQSFHPQKNVFQKTYWYHFCLERPLPFIGRFVWRFPQAIDSEKLKECLQVFIGTHDFRSFCSSDYQDDTVRTIDDIRLVYLKRYNVYRIEVCGQRFLYNMIRRIVGAALYVASRNNLSEDDLKRAIDAKNPEQILPNAPAHGLLLYKIVYEAQ